MKILKHWKKALSLLTLVALVISSFAVSAQALTLEGINYLFRFHISSIETFASISNEITATKLKNVKPLIFPQEINEDFTLWITSTDMEEDDNAGFCVPYFIDNNQKWYLQQISLSSMTSLNPSGGIYHLMTPGDIKDAKNEEAYKLDFSNITVDFPPTTSGNNTYYCLYYLWTSTPPSEWSNEPINPPTPPKSYTVSYNPNEKFFKDYKIKAIYPIKDNDGTKIIEITDAGLSLDQITVYAENTVTDNKPFKIGDKQYYNYLVIAEPKNNPNSFVYFELEGWKGINNTTYEPWAETRDFETLADDHDAIAFTAQWKQIEMLTDDELAEAEKSLPLNLIDAIDNTTYILYQWTDTDPNLRPTGTKSGDPVTLDEDGILSYQLSAKFNTRITAGMDSGAGGYGAEFADLTLHLTVDKTLEFASKNTDGTVSIQFSCPYMEPVATNTGTDTDISEKDSNDTYTITFGPENVVRNASGEMQIEIEIESVACSNVTPFSNPFSVTGLQFKLKEDTEVDPDTLRINSSANITGTLNMKAKTPTNPRNYLRTAQTLLSQYSNTWESVMGGDSNNPAALVRAAQFIDYKANTYNLSQDAQATTKANTVTATYPGTVTVTPANMTIYMGGDDGYDAVVDGTTTGNDVKPSNSMPTPLFYVGLSDDLTGTDVVEDITLTGAEGREWKFRLAGKDSSGTNLYYIVSTGFDGQDPVRVAFEGEDGKYHLNDTFDPAAVDELFTTYEISIYSGSAGTVLAQVDGKVHNVAVGTGTLTVRAVEETEDNPVVPVTETVTAPVSAGSAAVTAPSGTTYTLNDTTVPASSTGVGLLFDGIIDDATHNRTDALVEAIETDYRINVRDGYFQAQYLDLVDADNGNAWIKASNDVTVYWGYPEGTSQSTKFTLYHFTGLHRDNSQGSDSGFDINDIAKSAIEVVDIEKTANGIAFDVEPGGFSPFVLVWEKPSWPIIIPDIPEDTTPELLNTYDHDAYLQGYPDGRVKPENNITRAEVATIFYRLLTDDARNYYYSTDSGFSDVKPGDWYNTAVSTMVNAGILTGYNDGSFRPNDPITRAEFATIAARFLSDPYSLQDRFYDTEGHWAEVYINRAAEVGWINGYNDGSFRPDKAITRAEAMTLVNNVLGREPHADYMLDDMITWPDNPKSAWYYEDIQEATNSHDYRWSSDKRYEIWTSLN